ncbi:MAG TPA: sugar phosphate isomerase/epimerase family protein [Acidobacteriaceae bacterium]|jgi:sugar phosphate isomerase/epimerase
MRRRDFLSSAAAAAALLPTAAFASTLVPTAEATALQNSAIDSHAMPLGLLISPAAGPEETIRRVHDLGLPTCFLSLDAYIGKFTPALATEFKGLLAKYNVTCTTVEVVGPPPLVWDFMQGPSTIGLVPRATRAVRINALKQTSDFAKLLGVDQVQTHCGFIPENPADPLYKEAVAAIREVAEHCAANGQRFLMETGQETPTTMSRAIRDVGQPNLGVGLDTANLILYGKANPVDAVAILGPHVHAVHAKDGRWPTDPDKLGEEVLIGTGLVDFRKVFEGLRKAGYTGAITIERETNGPQQIEDVRKEKLYLEKVLAQVT